MLGKGGQNLDLAVNHGSDGDPSSNTQAKETPQLLSLKRKRGVQAVAEPIKGGWDILPHGMGKKGDLLDEAPETSASLPKKRARRGKPTNSEDSIMQDAEGSNAKEALSVDSIVQASTATNIKSEKAVEEAAIKPIARRSSRAKKSIASYSEPRGMSGPPMQLALKEGRAQHTILKSEEREDHVKEESIEDVKTKKERAPRKTQAAKPKEDDNYLKDKVKEEIVEGVLPKKKRAPHKAKLVNIEEEDDEVKDDNFKEKPKKKRTPSKRGSGDAPKERKKAHPYGLTPGFSPFPDHIMPTHEACEEVNRLLSELHGGVKAPEVVPPPSMDVTGCGEVPDLMDAMLRTLLSAATTGKNSAMALTGLKEKFGVRTEGLGKGSINWDAVHAATLPEVIDAVKRGGLGKSKGTNIKAILDVVYERNKQRRDALMKEKETGEPASVPGTEHETQAQKDAQLARFNETLLAMDYVFEMTTEEAMEEMIKLPGIGVKTASCVILFNMQRPSFAVDTHVWRHCKWLGWVPENADRDKTFSHCEVRVPDHLKYPLHQLFIRHGKTCGRCRASTSPGSVEWEETVCPIEHLVKRTGKRKMVTVAGKNPKPPIRKGAKGKKGTKKDNDTEESDAEVIEEESELSDDVEGEGEAEEDN